MNKKALFDNGIHPFAILLGLAGVVWAFWTSGRMEAGIFMRPLVSLLVGVVGFMVSNYIFTKD